MEDSNILLIVMASIIGFVIMLAIYHAVIKSAVKAAMKDQNQLIKKQNDILLMMLNKQGVDKDELMDIFLQEKKDMWPSLINYEK